MRRTTRLLADSISFSSESGYLYCNLLNLIGGRDLGGREAYIVRKLARTWPNHLLNFFFLPGINMALVSSSIQHSSPELVDEKFKLVETLSEQNPVVASAEFAYRVRGYVTDPILFARPLNTLPDLTGNQSCAGQSKWRQDCRKLCSSASLFFSSRHLQSSEQPNSLLPRNLLTNR
jgi:hypothetical protein